MGIHSNSWRRKERRPNVDDVGTLPQALEHMPTIIELVGRRRPAFFLDFDGTLAPISSVPSATTMPADMRLLLARLAKNDLVCVVSGRGLADLRAKVGLDNIYFAADHGHHIAGPEGSEVELEIAPADNLELEKASYELERRLRDIEGAIVETKGVSLSVHYRLVPEPEREKVASIVREVAEESSGLRLTTGKLVFELTPDLGWDKGKAVLWLLKRLGFRRSAVCPLCLGDDLTDEDMFRAAKNWGTGIVVGGPQRRTLAEYRLDGLDQVRTFLGHFLGAVSFSSGQGG
jgi:trehalose 6-phosphate phosphatase